MLEDIPDSSRRNMGIFLCSRDNDSLDIRSELSVRIRYRPLCLEVDHVADSPDDVPDAEFTALIDGQIVILDDADTFKAACSLTYDIHPLLIGEETPLVYIDTDSHDHLIEHGKGPLQNVEMSGCKRIE